MTGDDVQIVIGQNRVIEAKLADRRRDLSDLSL
jgi:hypothetical protein